MNKKNLDMTASDIIKIAVCDDEEVILNRIKAKIMEEFSKKKVDISDISIDTFQNKQSFLDSSNIYDYNIIFLDIDLKIDNGLDLAEELRNKGYNGIIIFITAFARYSIDGYKVEAFRFILKSNLDKGISECINVIVEKLGLNNFRFEELNVSIKEIIYIESCDHKLIFHLANNKKYECWGKLDDVEKKTENIELIRIHQSYIINMQHLRSIKRYSVILDNERELSIPKAKYNEVKTKIKIRRNIWS